MYGNAKSTVTWGFDSPSGFFFILVACNFSDIGSDWLVDRISIKLMNRLPIPIHIGISVHLFLNKLSIKWWPP